MLFLAAQIFLWLAVAFVLGAVIGWWYGSSSAIDNMQSTYDFKKATDANGGSGGGSIGVLSDSLLKTQEDLKNCQQSLAFAETKLSEMGIRFEREEDVESEEEPDEDLDDFSALDNESLMDIAGLDDLTLIRGIGPYIQKKLYEMDISTYKQIALLTDEEIEDIGKTINYFPSRIVRDNWKASARQLHEKKYGEMV